MKNRKEPPYMNKSFIRSTAFISAFCFALFSCSETKKTTPDSAKTTSVNSEASAQMLTELSENSYKLVKYRTIDGLNFIHNVKMTKSGEYYAFADFKDDIEENPHIYKISSDFSDMQKIVFELPDEAKKADDKYNSIVFDSEGDAAIYYTFLDNGDMEEPEEYDPNFDYQAFYENQTATHAICFYNKDGSIKKFIDLGTLSDEENTGYSEFDYFSSAEMPDSDTVVCLFDQFEIYILKSDGSCESIQLPSEYTQYTIPQLLTGTDGKVYLSTVVAEKDYSSTKTEILEIDTEAKEIKEPFFIEKQSYSLSGSHQYDTGYGDYLFIGSSDTDLIGVKADGTSETILKWLDADTTAMDIVPADNNEFYCFSYNNNMERSSLDVYKLVHRQAGELDNIQVITFASLDSTPLDYYISKFNREQDKYRIQIIDYSTELKPEDYENKSPQTIADRSKEDFNKLKLDIAAGKAPDILMLYESETKLLGKKGVLLDLYTLMDKDTKVNRDTIVPNILRALESNDGKLYSLAPSFSVSTIAAKKKLVDHENWTMQEMTDLFDSKDTASHRYDRLTKQQIFNMLVNSDSKLVDIENSECHFDTPEFIDMLKFCNRFVDEVEFGDKSNEEKFMEYCIEMSRSLMDEQELISQLELYGDRDLMYEKADFGDDDIELVGYPTSNGKGGKLRLDYEFSISANSSVKEGAWEFIKMLLNEASYSNADAGKSGAISCGYSVILDEFNKQVDAMSTTTSFDDEGNLTEVTSFESQGRMINCLTKEELDHLKRYILSCDTLLNSLDNDAYAVCYEEADEYFKGGKTAEEAAQMMQNRISILVSEKS